MVGRLESELKRLFSLVSDREKATNHRLIGGMEQIKTRLLYLRQELNRKKDAKGK